MRRLFLWAVSFGLIVGAAGWFATAPSGPDAAPALTGDPERGALVFAAGGCSSCHAADGATGDAKLVLAGGHALKSDFGTFVAPNISPHPEAGIGTWTLAQFIHAMRDGISPEGRYYYPAFPYTAYAKATDQDLVDLWAYMQTLPADPTPSQPHALGFPFTIDRGVALWNARYAGSDWVLTGDLSPEVARGRYLVEALGHCAECHTPRDAFGGLDRSAWLTGAPNPSGEGRIPGIAPGILDWSEADIAYYLETGFTPDFDSAGGTMADVVENTAKLPPEDRAAIAAYLKAVP